MKRLIVNADDFGLTASVNQAILEAHCRGVISSTSLLANGEAFESAVALSRQAPRLGVGVHLNLTEGKPLAPSSAIPSLVDRQGFFARTAGGFWRAVLLGQAKTADIEKEFRAQIERVMAAGITPTHLDSHKHVHALPALGTMAIRLACQYGIPAIRCVVERRRTLGYLLRRYPGATTTILRQLFNSWTLAVASRAWTGELRRAGVVFASNFYGVTVTGFLDEEILREFLYRLPDGVSELMCHPGFVDDDLGRTHTRLLRQREVEFQALTRPAIKVLAQDLGIQLVNYRDIMRAKSLA
jgi:hopanoid biosynthesis associated protein HpnK